MKSVIFLFFILINLSNVFSQKVSIKDIENISRLDYFEIDQYLTNLGFDYEPSKENEVDGCKRGEWIIRKLGSGPKDVKYFVIFFCKDETEIIYSNFDLKSNEENITELKNFGYIRGISNFDEKGIHTNFTKPPYHVTFSKEKMFWENENIIKYLIRLRIKNIDKSN